MPTSTLSVHFCSCWRLGTSATGLTTHDRLCGHICLLAPSVLCVSILIVLFVVFFFFLECSVCPELLSLAMVKKDFHLCQIAFQIFPDIPEAVTCACLKAILR